MLLVAFALISPLVAGGQDPVAVTEGRERARGASSARTDGLRLVPMPREIVDADPSAT